MAYLRELHQQCQVCRVKPATFAVINRFNEEIVRACTPCAKSRLKSVQANDDASVAAEIERRRNA